MKRSASFCVRSLSLALILSLSGADRPAAPAEEANSPSVAEQSVRFGAVDVFVDPQGQPLAAYQIEIDAEPLGVELVGIQGGDAAAFRDPPYYDPRALMGGRIVIAAFNLGKDLPSQKTRVATLMVRIPADARPKYLARLQVAASSDARLIHANVSVVEQGAVP